MGHTRLGNLPKTQKWEQIIRLIQSAADTGTIAAATLDASKRGLADAASDPALVHSLWLLAQIPLCARKGDYLDNLRNVGIETESAPNLMELVGSFSDSVDAKILHVGGRTDLGEMAQMGATASLAGMLTKRSATLFGTDAEDLRNELAKIGTPRNFSILARDFFARITEKYITYYLSRSLSNDLPTVTANKEFREALTLHCRQASKIVESFAAGWFSKRNFKGGITHKNVAEFTDYAMKKVRRELARETGDGDR
jgi:hypothetical protein